MQFFQWALSWGFGAGLSGLEKRHSGNHFHKRAFSDLPSWLPVLLGLTHSKVLKIGLPNEWTIEHNRVTRSWTLDS